MRSHVPVAPSAKSGAGPLPGRSVLFLAPGSTHIKRECLAVDAAKTERLEARTDFSAVDSRHLVQLHRDLCDAPRGIKREIGNDFVLGAFTIELEKVAIRYSMTFHQVVERCQCHHLVQA